MAKFQTEFNSVSSGAGEFTAVDGVIEIPDQHIADFKPFIDCGQLVQVDETAPAAEGEGVAESDGEATKKTSRKAKS
jgi:hypothetical protein